MFDFVRSAGAAKHQQREQRVDLIYNDLIVGGISVSQFHKVPNLTVEEYLAREERATVRHEYVNGQVFAMTGATEAHNVICGNLHASLHEHLKGSGCRVFMSDMKVRIETSNSFYYPDIMVTCEPFAGTSVFKQSPVFIAEILSPSTKHIDRREKLIAYRQIDSLREYVIIDPSRHRIEDYRKDANGQWEMMVLRRSDVVSLASLPSSLDISVETIYEGVILSPAVEEEEEEYELSGI